MTVSTGDLVTLAVGAVAGWTAGGSPKAQGVRLLDVWALGPLMAYVAMQTTEAGELSRLALLAAGAATVTFNGRNYLRAAD